jgi:hypothetical protein
MCKYFAALIASMLANFAFADTWYVTLDAHNADYGEGGETASGESWDAAITLTNAVARAQAGDTILVEGGTYELSPKYSASLVVSQPITIKGGMLKTPGSNEESVSSENPYSIFDAKNTIGYAFYVNTATAGTDWNVFERCVFTRGSTRGFHKTGKASLKLIDCEIRDNGNGTGGERNGFGGYFSGDAAASYLVLSNSVIAGNVNMASKQLWKNSYGIGLYLLDYKQVTLYNCSFLTNGIPLSSSYKFAPNGQYVQGAAIYAKNVFLDATNCKFIANKINGRQHNMGVDRDGYYQWGGIIRLENTAAQFNKSIFLANATIGGNGKGTYDGTIVVNSSGKTCAIDGCTFAFNVADTTSGSAGIRMQAGTLNIKNTIFANNIVGSLAAYGCDLHLAGGVVNIEYSMFGGDSSRYLSTQSGNGINIGEGVIYGDAKLVSGVSAFADIITKEISEDFPVVDTGMNLKSTCIEAVNNLDVHLLSTTGYRKNNDSVWYMDSEVSSPAIDAGDPKVDVGDEPFGENGNRINLGVYGGTSEASKSPSAGAIVLTQENIEISYNEYGQPKISITAGVEPSTSTFEATANITITGTLVGETTPSTFALTIDGIKPGMKYESAFLNEYFVEGSELEISVILTPAIGQPVSVEGIKTTMSGILPECAGHGSSDSHVIHYWPNAPGKNDGSSWLHAYTSFSNAVANLTADKNILWIAGDSVLTSVTRPITYSPNYEVKIIGGFTGVEDSEEERAVGVISVLDGNDAVVPFSLNNAAKVEFDSIKFRRGAKSNIVKSGQGDVVFSNCQFTDAGSWQYASGGSYSGSGLATLIFTNCLFYNNYPTVAWDKGWDYRHGGYGAFIDKCKRVIFDDCYFKYNGKQDKPTTQRSDYGGGALYVSSSPVTMRNTRFEGNRNLMSAHASRTDAIGIVHICGDGGADSAFTNCVWVGNEDRPVESSGSKAPGGGMVSVEYTSAQRNVDFVNCTFAYNLVDGAAGSTAGISVLKGSANIVNSIFYGSVTGATCNAGKYLHVAAGATANVRNSLFESAEDISFVDSDSVTTKNLIYGDPLFIYSYDQFKSELLAAAGTSLNLATVLTKINNGQLNYHLSGAGYYDESGVITNRVKGVKSPAVDAGVKVGEFKEPVPNGNKVNLGFYGNTPGATLSTGGFIIIIR